MLSLRQVHLRLGLLLTLPLGLQFQLEVTPLLLLLGKLLLETGQSLLLPGSSRDESIDPGLQTRLLYQ